MKGGTVTLEHGSGGALSRDLIEKIVYPVFRSGDYPVLSDAASFELSGNLLLTTDTYVVDPPCFPGGDIGKLAVFGTCNDLSVCGAKARFLTLSLVLEEGFPIPRLEAILRSVSGAAASAEISIITGDTKVVPAGKGGNIFINTAGVGEREFTGNLSAQRAKPGDAIIVTGPLGSHGIAVLASRERLEVAASIESDCAHLHEVCRVLYDAGTSLRFMRDATRGGVAAVFNEICQNQPFGMDIEEALLPVLEEVAVVSDLLGLNPLEIANEGVIVAVIDSHSAAQALRRLSQLPSADGASAVGVVTAEHPGKVHLKTHVGGWRVLDFPRGLLLPRIC
jgi:hydrogenase expression/formation protein HypE